MTRLEPFPIGARVALRDAPGVTGRLQEYLPGGWVRVQWVGYATPTLVCTTSVEVIEPQALDVPVAPLCEG